jgi:drug/metabolite transporter (DMT)-like permease
MPLLAVLLISQVVGFGLVGCAVLAARTSAPSGAYVLYAGCAGVALTAAVAALYRAMAIGAMSVASPIAATSAVLPLVYGFARGERPSVLQCAGVALALLGVVLVSIRAETAHDGARWAAGAGLAAVAGVCFGCFYISMDASSAAGVLWATFLQRLTAVTLLVATALVLATTIGHRVTSSFAGEELRSAAVIGALDVTGTALFAAATTQGLTGLVSVLASLAPVTIIVLARVVLHERLTRRHALGVVGALGGVVLIAAG